MDKIETKFRTKLPLGKRILLALKYLFRGKTITVVYEDPVDFKAFMMMKELKKKKIWKFF